MGVSTAPNLSTLGDKTRTSAGQRNTPDSPAPQTHLVISVTGSAAYVLSKKYCCACQLGLMCLLCLVGNTPSLGFLFFAYFVDSNSDII